MLMGKTIMILGAGVLQLPAIKKAAEMGLKVVALDMNPDAVGFSVSGVACEIISTIDIPAAIEAAKRHNIDGVMTLATDMPMRTVAAVAKECGLVGISDDTALKATNKAFMREALAAQNVPVPKFFRARNRNEFLDSVKGFSAPFIIKPADNSGSRGICLIKDIENKEEVSSAYEYALQFSRSGDVVLEEYMSGAEVSVETMAVNGEIHVIRITDKITTGFPRFVEMGHTQPGRLNEEIKAEIAEVAKAANKAVGIENGPSHTEIIVTDEGAKIVEIGARLGGDCITTDLVPLSTGVDMVECCIRIALGERPDIRKKFDKGSAIRYFPQHAGKVLSISGLNEAAEMPGVKRIQIVHGVGENITDIDSSGARMGFVIAQGEDAGDAARKCEAALGRIRIEIE